MESSHNAELNIPELKADASIAHVFPGMSNHSLLSVGQLCNEGYIVTFKNASVTICDPKEFQIMSGAWDLDTGLWRINLSKDNQKLQQAVANNVYELRNTGALVNYLHKSLSIPTKSALLQAVKKRASRNLARLNRGSNQQTFEAHAGHGYGAHESKTSEH
jgi:hypothetical protein